MALMGQLHCDIYYNHVFTISSVQLKEVQCRSLSGNVSLWHLKQFPDVIQLLRFLGKTILNVTTYLKWIWKSKCGIRRGQFGNDRLGGHTMKLINKLMRTGQDHYFFCFVLKSAAYLHFLSIQWCKHEIFSEYVYGWPLQVKKKQDTLCDLKWLW